MDFVSDDYPLQGDLLLKLRPKQPLDNVHDWWDVWVVGEIRQSDQNEALRQLRRYVRDVFASQPTRRLVHAFTLCGSYFEPRVLDRSGCASPGPFNIIYDERRLIQIIAGHAMMTDEELGLVTLIKEDDGYRVINIESENPQEPATSGDWDYVTKFSWTSDRRKQELDLLRLALSRGVQCIATLVGSKDVTSIKDIRSGLYFPNAHRARGSSRSTSGTQGESRPRGLSALSKSDGIVDTEKTAGSAQKRPISTCEDSSKRRKHDCRNLADGQVTKAEYSNAQAQGTSLNDAENISYDNRILRCLVISLAGKALYKFQKKSELLGALRDTIQAHKKQETYTHERHSDLDAWRNCVMIYLF
ncbi:hypothetical protein TSTA_010600 [Talaromyces stipitatus ATCC 10500]|uniref:Fungal-type protein kinase domain-containing protein n=1 Tax=Talaromyces stipitatus (strain ATCC 10500 / CBS 375.48 / QM 6759 / NRRL 1006) TaxID=441959 RepID=B8MG77_TALSN|nr:uncharacterized protein TSTA_010600 [Talaromyces stipitatus ATCC 10500]EED15944.1 hypothetical protein TSTA_010600 [Talaromyces stipitatus ATCC 10500]